LYAFKSVVISHREGIHIPQRKYLLFEIMEDNGHSDQYGGKDKIEKQRIETKERKRTIIYEGWHWY